MTPINAIVIKPHGNWWLCHTGTDITYTVRKPILIERADHG